MPKTYRNRVFDSSNNPVYWNTPAPDSAGTFYPGAGVFGVDTSDFSAREVFSDSLVHDITSYGAVGDGVVDDYTSINNAVTDIGASPAVLYFPTGNYLIGTSVTFPANITPRFEHGAILLDDGVGSITATFQGQIEAGTYQIFNFTGTGSGAAFSVTEQRANIEWWGVSTSATPTQNTTRANAAVAALINKGVILVNGNYTVDGEISASISAKFDYFWIEGNVPDAGFTHDSSVAPGTNLLSTSYSAVSLNQVNGPVIPTIKNLNLYGYQSGGVPSTNACLIIHRGLRGGLENIWCEDAAIGIATRSCFATPGRALRVDGCGIAFDIGCYIDTTGDGKFLPTNACKFGQLLIRDKVLGTGVPVTNGIKFSGYSNPGHISAPDIGNKNNHFDTLDYTATAGSGSTGLELVGSNSENVFTNLWFEKVNVGVKFTIDPLDSTARPENNRFKSLRIVVANHEMDLTVGLDNIFEGGFMAANSIVDLGPDTANNQFHHIRAMPFIPNSPPNPGNPGLNDQGNRNIVLSHGTTGASNSNRNYHSEDIALQSNKAITSLPGASLNDNGGNVFIRSGNANQIQLPVPSVGDGGSINLDPGRAGPGGGSDGNVLICENRGKVGIGFGNPLTALHVNGEVTLGGSGGPNIRRGFGDPALIQVQGEPTVGLVAPKGSLFLRADGGRGSTLYTKYGTQNNAWSPRGTTYLIQSLGTAAVNGVVTEEDLGSVVIPQNSHLEYQTLFIKAAGTKAGGAGTKTLRFYFYETNNPGPGFVNASIIVIHPPHNDALPWQFSAELDLRTATVHRCMWRCFHHSITYGYDSFPLAGKVADMSSDSITVKFTGQLSDGGDTIAQAMFMAELVR